MPKTVPAGGAKSLTKKERLILDVLKRTGEASNDEIIRAAWPDSAGNVSKRTVAVYICEIRRKIAPHKIENVNRRGYRFVGG